jgi:hypothetical protein
MRVMHLDIAYKGTKYIVQVDEGPLNRALTWRLKKSGNKLYLSAPIYLGKVNGKYKYNHVYYHQLLTKAKIGEYVDHINGNTLDNRLENLRLCSNAENCRNQGLRKNNKTGVKGVRQDGKKYVAQINKDGKTKYLGTYPSIEEAKKVYTIHAVAEYGEFAKII